MKPRAGIFDPWRQTDPLPAEEDAARKPTATEPSDDSISALQHCIQFNGLRAGIHVWLSDSGGDDSMRARELLVDLVHRLVVREELKVLLRSWGVHAGTPDVPNPVVLGDPARSITISAPSEDRLVSRAIDSMSLALREASAAHPSVRDLLSALKIRPFVK